MKKYVPILGLLFVASISVNAQTVNQIISKYIKARGGYEKLLSLRCQRLTGTISFSPSESSPFSVTMERPFKMKEEMSIKGKKIIRVLNGSSGWMVNAFSGKGEVQPLPKLIIENMQGASDFDGPLVDYKAKGNKIEFVGMDTVGSKIAYKLKIIQKNGVVGYEDIDTRSNLELMWEGKIGDKGNEHLMQSFFSSYKKVKGIMYACRIVSISPGTASRQVIIINKVEVNPKLNKNFFSKPMPVKVDK